MENSPSPLFDPRVATASELQSFLQDRKTTSVQLVMLYLEQIKTHNGYLHAVISTAPEAALLQEAERLDRERERGTVRSAMHGIPILVKDNIATSPSLGMETTAGSFALKGSRPRKSADLIEKLTEAGAIILGKANLSELSYFKGEDLICGWSAVGGQSQSAYVRGGLQKGDTPAGHSNPGGSSSGSAIAVSAGLAPVSIDTETSGSLISPASKAALYTIKPTIGLIAQQGIVPISSLADSAGPMTKSVVDLANLMDILVDPTKKPVPQGGYKAALTGTWEDLKIGVLNPADCSWGPLESQWTEPDPGATKQMNEAFESAYATIESRAKVFHRFVPFRLLGALKIDGEFAHRKLFTGHFKSDFEAYLADLDFAPVKSLEELVQFNRDHAEQELPPRYPSQDRLEAALADKSTPEELDAALNHARKVARDEGIDRILKEYDIDAIIGPAESAMPTIASASGYPIAGMPLGYLEFNGRPFGMAAIAASYQEATLIKVQSAWEATFPPRKPPPYDVFCHESSFGNTFQSLDERISVVLGVLCFLSPDTVPQSVFEVQSASALPQELRFCADQLAFRETIENLVTLALIKRDKETQTLSVHTLVQVSFNAFLTAEQRQTCFNNATILVANAFPRRDTASAQLYLKWKQCAPLLQHVLSLKDCFRKELAANPDFKALQVYCELNNAYLLETNTYSDLEDLIQVNTTALGTLPEAEQTINLQGSLTSHRGQLLLRLGKPHEGVKWLRESYKVRSQLVPVNLRELAWAAENAANGVATINEFVEAVQWHEQARDHWLEWSEENGQPGEWPAVLKKSMGTTLIWAGQRGNARKLLTQAIGQIENTDPYNWAMAAYTHFALGTLDRHDGLYESAEAHFMEAQNLWTKGGQLRTDPFNATCMYKMGCVALDQFKVKAAIERLWDAKVVTDIHKGELVAEHARCIFKLSEALQQEPRAEVEAGMLQEEAERMIRAHNPKAIVPGSEATYDDLVNILWR